MLIILVITYLFLRRFVDVVVGFCMVSDLWCCDDDIRGGGYKVRSITRYYQSNVWYGYNNITHLNNLTDIINTH